MSKQKWKSHLEQYAPALFTPGAGDAFAQNNLNFTTYVEALAGEGAKAHIKSITLFVRAYTALAGTFVIQPVIVQTAGTFTDTVGIAQAEISEILDAAIDDEFGFQEIGQPNGRKMLPIIATYDKGFERNIIIPQNIINLLNKETSTERLQSIYFGVVGQGQSSPITMSVGLAIKFRLVDKGITIR